MNTDDLIGQLSAALEPVRRLKPPAVRAALWLLAVAALAAVPVLLRSDLPVFVQRVSDPRLALEVLATLATGVTGAVAAFHLAAPDRSRRWALLPLPFAAAWLALSGAGCWPSLPGLSHAGEHVGHNYCFAFLLATGVPLAGLLLLSLRTARPLQPNLVAMVGALGVAGLAAFILQFFHPFDMTAVDFVMHLAALAILFALLSLSSRRALA